MIIKLHSPSQHQAETKFLASDKRLEISPIFYAGSKHQDVSYIELADDSGTVKKFVLQATQDGGLRLAALKPLVTAKPEAETEDEQ